jgi:hypothetical protein
MDAGASTGVVDTISSMQKSSPTRSALAVSGRGKDVDVTGSLTDPFAANSCRAEDERICSASASTALIDKTAEATS